MPLSQTIAGNDEADFIRKGFEDLIAKFLKSESKGVQKYAKTVEEFADPGDYYKCAKATVESAKNDGLLKILEEIKEIRVSILCMLGDQSLKHGIHEAAKQFALETAIISESGHFAFTDNPKEFYSKLADWLNQMLLRF